MVIHALNAVAAQVTTPLGWQNVMTDPSSKCLDADTEFGLWWPPLLTEHHRASAEMCVFGGAAFNPGPASYQMGM